MILPCLCGCGGSSSNSKTLIGLSGLTQNFDGSEDKWRELLDGAAEANVSFLHLQTAPWSEAEPAPGIYDFSYFDNYFKIQSEYNLSYTLDISTPLGIGAVDLPSDIQFSSFDDPELITRYKAYLTALLGKFTSASHIILHTETAGSYFGNDVTSTDFIAFCELISISANHIRSVLPDVKVGIYGTTQESAEVLDCLNQSTDFFGISHIADRADDDHQAILDSLLSKAGDKAIALFEFGIPTADLLGGSEAAQVNFVNLVFDFANLHKDRVLFMSYYQYLDEEESITRQYVPIQFPNYTSQQQQELIAFLSSLGLLRANGSPKLAWSTFKERVSLSK